MGRSGSNTLVDMLNQNPAILNFGEVLGEWNRIRRVQRAIGLFKGDDRAYLNAILGSVALQRTANLVRTFNKIRRGRFREIKRISSLKTVGFKEFSLNIYKYGVEQYVTEADDIKIIGLTRRNVLDRLISNDLLAKTGIVASTSVEQPLKSKIWIDPETIIDRLEIIQKENDLLYSMIYSIPPYRLIHFEYEDLYGEESLTIERIRSIYNFLGAPDMTPRVRMRKIVDRNALSIIENRLQIEDIVRQSRFSCYLPSTDFGKE